MTSFLLFIFVAWLVLSAFLQAAKHPLKDYLSPALTAVCGLLILYGALSGSAPMDLSIVIAIALILLAASDFTFERSTKNEKLFPLAMVFGVVSGLMIGITFNLHALQQGLTWPQLLGLGLIGVLSSIWVYRYLDVAKELRPAIYVYLAQAVILLTGGLASLVLGNFAFAVWGIFIFISDALVGLRAFPSKKRPISWLTTERILLLIIVIYYAAQYAMASWALGS